MARAESPGRFTRLRRLLLHRTWYVQPPTVMMIQAAPAACLVALSKATKPRTEQLHLRNLFVEGRRYHIHPRPSGFSLTTTSKILWRYRQRTSASAVLIGCFSAISDDVTHIHMEVNIRLVYLLDVFLIPTFMASILVFTPWNPLLILALILALYALSWFGHRYNAAFEANEMVFFVQKALEEFSPAEVLGLSPATSDVVTATRDFREAWDKFYEAHKDEQ